MCCLGQNNEQGNSWTGKRIRFQGFFSNWNGRSGSHVKQFTIRDVKVKNTLAVAEKMQQRNLLEKYFARFGQLHSKLEKLLWNNYDLSLGHDLDTQ